VGVSWQGSMRYAIPISLPKWPVQEIQFGYDFKRSNNNLQFGGISISNTLTDIDQFVLTYGTVIDDPLGQTKFSNRMALSPGLFSPYNNDAAFQPSSTHNGVPFAKAFYFYNDISATRLTKLPWDMGALTRIEAQFSTANLLASERLGIGGVESVRGYDEYTASGSEGFIFSQEIRSPAFGLLSQLFGKDSINDKMQYFVFYDFGYVRERKEVPGTGGSYLASTGAGFQYALDRYLSVSLDCGVQLRTATGASRKSGQLELSVTANN
jgi:hemolysin activation/secretion protein